MKKILIIAMLIASLLLCSCSGCGKKSEESTDTTSVSKENGKKETFKPMTADEMIKEAESASFKSGDAGEASLYESEEIPYTSLRPFMQTHLSSEFESYAGDEEFFTPVSPDYFMGQFVENTTVLYDYDFYGELVYARRRVVYESREALLSANKDSGLVEDSYNEEGKTYHGNVLYEKLSDEGMFIIEPSAGKYSLLKTAAAGAFEKPEYIYYFSMPYKPEKLSLYLYEGILPPGDREDFDEEDDYTGYDEWPEDEIVDDTLTEAAVYDLFTEIMDTSVTYEKYQRLFAEYVPEDTVSTFYNTSFPKLSDYEGYKTIITVEENGYAYAALYMYTIPEGYVTGDKFPDYIVGGVISYDSNDGRWKYASCDDSWAEIQTGYYASIFTEYGFDALASGNICQHFWVPCNIDRPILIEDAMVAKVTEAFFGNDGNFYVTVYLANGTGKDMTLKSIDYLTLDCEYGPLLSISSGLNETVASMDVLYEILCIPYEYLEYEDFSRILGVSEFACTVE